MNAMLDPKAIARRYGGTANGNQVNIPTEGHPRHDRGTSITVDPSAPDGLLVHVHNGGDPLAVKDRLRRDGFLPDREVQRRDVVRPMFKKAPRQPGVSCFEYQDADGVTVCRKVRTDTANGKSFSWQHPDGKGGWINGRGCDALFYHLPELIATPADAVIYVAEGERKADKLVSWGLVATSSKDLPDDLSLLAGRRVVILPDNDDEGAKIAGKLQTALEGIAERAVLLDLPGLPHKGDIMDWGGTASELEKLAANALAGEKPSARVPSFKAGVSAAALMAMQFDPIRYIVTGYIAEGLTVLAGAPKIGKSWMALNIAVAVASDRPAFGSVPCVHGDVLYLALEDNPRRLRSRLLKMGVRQPPERLTFCTSWPSLGDGAVAEIEVWADAVEKPVLVIVDVLAKVRDAANGRDSAYDADYRTLTGLQELAGRLGLAIVPVHHTRKMDADDPFDSVSGTRGLTGAADTVLVLKRDIGTARTVLYGRGRDIEEIETAFEFDRDIGTWQVIGAAADLAKTDERQAIRDVLVDTDKALTAREISDILGKSYEAVRKTLTRMAHAGEIEKEGRGLYTCPKCPIVPNDAHAPPDWDIGTDGTGVCDFPEQSDDDGWLGESPAETAARLSRSRR